MTAAGPWTPACMSPEELALWARGNGHVAPCEDCTLGYAADMRAVGRCNGTPAGAEEDEMETSESAVREAMEIIVRQLVTTVAPCPSCVHARVCRLRPADELDVRVSLPVLASELTISLTATVECMEYVPVRRVKTATPMPAKPQTGRAAMTPAKAAALAKAREVLAARRAESVS